MALSNLLPLVILFALVGGGAWIGYQVTSPRSPSLTSLPIPHHPLDVLANAPQIYIYSNELAARGTRKLEKKNVVFTKDGAKVGVREVSAESYADKTQKAFVKTWNAAQDG